MDNAYKIRHEAFVSSDTGGCGLLSLLAAAAAGPAALLLTRCAMYRYYTFIELQSSAIREKFGFDLMSGADPEKSSAVMVLEFIFFALPQLLAVTVAPSTNLGWSFPLGLLFFAVLLLPDGSSSTSSSPSVSNVNATSSTIAVTNPTKSQERRWATLTYFRG